MVIASVFILTEIVHFRISHEPICCPVSDVCIHPGRKLTRREKALERVYSLFNAEVIDNKVVHLSVVNIIVCMHIFIR